VACVRLGADNSFAGRGQTDAAAVSIDSIPLLGFGDWTDRAASNGCCIGPLHSNEHSDAARVASLAAFLLRP